MGKSIFAFGLAAVILLAAEAWAGAPTIRTAPPRPGQPPPAKQDPSQYPTELAKVHLRYDQPARAIEELEKAQKLAKSDDAKADISLTWAEALLKQDKAAEAKKLFEKAMELTKNLEQRCNHASQFAERLSRAGKIEEATPYYEYVLENTKEESRQRMVRWQLAFAYRRADKVDLLVQKQEEKLKANPDDESALHMLLTVYTVLKRDGPKAIEIAERLVKLNPDDKDVLRPLAQQYRMSGKTDKAIATYEKLIKLDPNSKSTYYAEILRAYQSAGQHAKAIDWAKKLTDENPDSYRNWKQLAECYGAAGDVPKAVEAQQKAISVAKPGREKDEARLALAQAVYERNRRYREAKQIYFELSKDASTHNMRARAKRALIDLYQRTGELDKVQIRPPK